MKLFFLLEILDKITSNSLLLPSAGVGVVGQLDGRPPDVVDQVGSIRVLERSRSPVDLVDKCNPKKLKGKVMSGDLGSEACDMETDGVQEPRFVEHVSPVAEDQGQGIVDKNSASRDGTKEPSGASQPKKGVSYAQVVASGLNRDEWFADEQSLNTGDVIVLDEDCVVSEEGDFPTIRFSERVHAQGLRLLQKGLVKNNAYKQLNPDRRSKNGGSGVVADKQVVVIDLDSDQSLGADKRGSTKLHGVRGIEEDDPGDGRGLRLVDDMEGLHDAIDDGISVRIDKSL
ncbi:hypothetical protein V6N11_075156 [Hibiscus sabdariffa]|uniref:Uncharacterized protein n=1 Tax=Hibiscus sabdariffa TaxID=183260 RepID=A0ABR2R5U6_9ROSI